MTMSSVGNIKLAQDMAILQRGRTAGYEQLAGGPSCAPSKQQGQHHA